MAPALREHHRDPEPQRRAALIRGELPVRVQHGVAKAGQGAVRGHQGARRGESG